jgi:hypothetical protein
MVRFLRSVSTDFGIHFGIPNRAKTSQDGFQKLSKRAQVTKRNVFANMRFDMFFCMPFGTLGLPKKPHDVQETLQDCSGELPETARKKQSICGPRSNLQITPKNGTKSCPKMVQKRLQNIFQNMTRNSLKMGPRWAPKWTPSWL